MTLMRRCNRKPCAVTRSDDPPGVGGYTTFPLEGRSVDLCPECTKKLKAWLDGLVDYPLPEENPA